MAATTFSARSRPWAEHKIPRPRHSPEGHARGGATDGSCNKRQLRLRQPTAKKTRADIDAAQFILLISAHVKRHTAQIEEVAAILNVGRNSSFFLLNLHF
jgi:hypothetical protein